MADDTEARRRAVEREYRDGPITVYWAPEFCIHTTNCLRAQPHVFDSARRPWVILDHADADAIAEAVMLCPTGALSFTRHDGGAEEELPEETEVEPRHHGPLFVRGNIRVADPAGNVLREATRVAFCRCGGSSNKPFCDGTHRQNGFRG